MGADTVVFVANRGYALTSSRTNLLKHFLSCGWNVVIATAVDKESESLLDLGVFLEPVSFDRGGFSLLADLKTSRRLYSIYKKWRPSLVQHFHAKPVILGTLMARQALAGSVRIVNTITGLGHAFIVGGSSAKLASLGYRLALPKADMTVFQNADDHALFAKQGWVSNSKSKIIVSSGIDMQRFPFVEREGEKNKAPVIVMLGRLLMQKGLEEFVEVARRIHKDIPNAKFLWAGEEDLVHPDSVSARWLQDKKDVEYVGRLANVRNLLEKADLLLFPSYREGVPRVVLEASAMGIPTVGFAVPGVREVVKNEQTGYLVENKNIEDLASKVKLLLEDKPLRLKMGKAARELVEHEFDINVVAKKYIKVYSQLGGKIT